MLQDGQLAEKQYDENFVAILETMWGEGFLSSGGTEAVKNIFAGIELNNKKILDIGCGIGGPDIFLVKNYSVEIVGVDIEKRLIARAKENLQKAGVMERLEFQVIKPNEMPFAPESFDVVYAKESLLHVDKKLEFFEKIWQVLKPGGVLCITDWMHSSPNYSADMRRFMIIDGLTYYFVTPNEYMDQLKKAGFVNITMTDITAQKAKEARDDCQKLRGEYADKVQKKFGEQYLKSCLNSWELELKVFENREVLAGLIRAYKKG